MRKKQFSFVLFNGVLIALLGLGACSDDKPNIPDDSSGGIPVANGFYVASTDEEVQPTAANVLVSEEVAAESISTQTRDGFVGNLMFLATGSYNVVRIEDRAITETYGGSSEVLDPTGSGDCKADNGYALVSNVALDGDAFIISQAGLYKVTYDDTRSEIIVLPITRLGILGTSTEGGWSSGQELSLRSSTADSVVFRGEGIVMRAGEYKVRFNCRWDISRLIDENAGLGAANGYKTFTNYGGSTNAADGSPALALGGPNFKLLAANEGVYTVNVRFAGESVAVRLIKTGDAPEVTFNPDNFKWGLIGSASINGWDKDDLNFFYKGLSGGKHTWINAFPIGKDEEEKKGEFKIRANDTWDVNLGVGGVNITGSAMISGSDNFILDGADNFYLMTLSTSDDGASWDLAIEPATWGIIGNATPTGWESDTDLTYDDNRSSASVTIALTEGEYKFRVNDAWDFNVGGDNISELVLDGANLKIATAKTYTIGLNMDSFGNFALSGVE